MIEHDRIFIGGEWRRPATGDTLEVVSPASEEVVGRVPLSGPADIAAAVAAARRAFDEGPWPRLDVEERRAVLKRAGALLEAQADQLDALVTSENGTLLRNHPGHTERAFRYLAEVEVPAPEDRRAVSGARALIVHEPAGVVAAIVPWNGPLWLAALKVIPALLAGCTVVLKPAPETPLDSYPLAQAFADAGLPPGALNVVTAHREVAQELVSSRDVDVVSFTGSTAAGRRIGAICGEQIKRVFLELGGKSAAIILDDAEVETTVPAVLAGGMLMHNGQSCVAWSRVLVPASRHDEVVDAIRDHLRSVRIGDPSDATTDLGPLVSSRQRGRVEGYIAVAQQEGAKVACGGGRPKGLECGWYVEPTLLIDATNSMRSSREEIFGPVASVIPYRDVDDAVRIANDSDYGLSGAVFTADAARGRQVAERVRTGSISVNQAGSDLAFPFGGYKASGLGRQNGPEGLLEYLEIKTIGLPAADVGAQQTGQHGTGRATSSPPGQPGQRGAPAPPGTLRRAAVCHQNTQAPPPSQRRNVEWAGADRVPVTVFDPPPGGTGPWAIIATDIFGVTPFYEHIGSLIAEAGYRVAIPDLFHRVGPARDGSREAALERRTQLDDRQALADLEAVLEAVAVSGSHGRQYAMMGFCLGGSLALLTAAAHPEQATVTYYAFPRGAPNPRVPAPAPLDVAASIQGPVLAHWGREDYIDAGEVELLARALSHGTAPHRIVWYDGAGHSFLSGLTEPGPNSAAASDSWHSTIAFLAEQVPLQ